MDEQLAQIYGTGGTDAGEDLQKTAAAELLVKLAADEGIDLDKCSDEQIAGMVQELYKTAEEESAESSGEESKEETKEEEKKEEEAKKEGEAKFAEADFLGRVMAHSMTQELGLIKEGKGSFGKATQAVSKFVTGRPAVYRSAGKDVKKDVTGKKSLTDRLKAIGSAGKKVAPEAGLLAAGGVGAAAALHKKKEGSALDQLASQRAFELAKEAGYIDQEGKLMVPEAKPVQKEASALDLAVEQRALEMLEASGIPVEWNK